MLNDIDEKKLYPGHEQKDSMPEENTIPQLPIPTENEEQDLDDLIHNNLGEEIATTEEIDADDAVHHIAGTRSLEHDDEKDPDDLVHGN